MDGIIKEITEKTEIGDIRKNNVNIFLSPVIINQNKEDKLDKLMNLLQEKPLILVLSLILIVILAFLILLIKIA